MTATLCTSFIQNGIFVRIRLRSQIGSFFATSPPVGNSRRFASSASTNNAGPVQRIQQQRRRGVLEFRATDNKYFKDWFDTEESSTGDSNFHQHQTTRKDAVATTTSGRRATIYEIPDDATQKWEISHPAIIKDNHKSSLLNTNGDTAAPTILSANVIRQGFLDHVVKHFLPAEYPHSVADGYARFTVLAFSASVAGSAAMVLSTQTLLLAVGVVGQSALHSGSASIMAGALNWVLKDGIGQLGGVIFASKMGEMKRFDSDPKRWRMLAALSLDGASFLEILSPLVWSSWVLPVACIANIGKNIGFLTASASRAAIHQSLAIKGNLADVTAKSASQSMAAGLLGTGVGIGLSTFLDYEVTNFILGFCALSMIHQGCNYQSLKSVPLQHFNRHRLHILLSKYMETGVVLEPSQVANLERYFPLLIHDDDSHKWLSIGSSLHDLCPGSSSVQDFEEIYGLFQNESYLLNLEEQSNRIHLVFQSGATGEDLIQGMYHAYLLRNEKNNNGTKASSLELDISRGRFQKLESSYEKAETEASGFLKHLESKDWKTGTDVTNVEPPAAFRLSIHDPS